MQLPEARTDVEGVFLTRAEAAIRLSVSRQRIEKLLQRWPEVETSAGIDVEKLIQLRTSASDPYPAGYVSRRVAGKVLGISRQRIQKLLKRFPEAVTVHGVDVARLRQLRREPSGARSDAPRGLSLPGATAYVGLTESQFIEEVQRGSLPKPRLLKCGARIWDRNELDHAIDAAPVDISFEQS